MQLKERLNILLLLVSSLIFVIIITSYIIIDPENTKMGLYVIQMGFLISSGTVLLIYKISGKPSLLYKGSVGIKKLPILTLIFILMILSSTALGILNGYILEQFDYGRKLLIQDQKQVELLATLYTSNTIKETIIGIFAIGILPAFAEELFFRGILLQVFNPVKRPMLAILSTAVIFGLLHFQLTNLLVMILLAILFGYLYLATKSILVPIIFHCLFNLANWLTFQFGNIDSINEWTEKNPEVPLLFLIALPSLIITLRKKLPIYP